LAQSSPWGEAGQSIGWSDGKEAVIDPMYGLIDFLNEQIKQLVKQNEACCRLLDIEGVGPISAVLLFATLGTGKAFKNGREFSAYVGLTPKQYSSGGKTNLIGISRYIANHRLRSS